MSKLREWWLWRRHPERKAWQAWSKNKRRCPYCINDAPADFRAICDCWRYEWEVENGLISE